MSGVCFGESEYIWIMIVGFFKLSFHGFFAI